MGIKAGSGKGAGDAGGTRGKPFTGGVGSSRKRDRVPIEPAQPKGPLKPVENPFPEKKDFRLGHYRILEERDDYLLCTGFDPNAKNPFSEVTPTAFRTGTLMKVAKPPLLQRTAWDGQSITIDGVEYTYEYSDDEFGVRTATWVDGEEEQRIYPPYMVDDLLVAVEIRKSAAVDGMEVTDEEEARLRWIDLNVSGRHWKGQDGLRDAELTSTMSPASNSKTGATTFTGKFLVPDDFGNLIDGGTFTGTNRSIDASGVSGDYCVVARIGREIRLIWIDC